MDIANFTPSILTENLVAGLVINFGGELAQAVNGISVPVWAAEIKHVEQPDSLGGMGLYIMPEDADEPEGNDLYIWPTPGVAYEIVS